MTNQTSTNDKLYIKLSEYAKIHEIPYRTAFEWWQKGKISGFQNDKGSIFIEKSYIKNNDSPNTKLISQKYFMDIINQDSYLSNITNFIFGGSDDHFEHEVNIDYTSNIDIILDKTKLWLIKSFKTYIFHELYDGIDFNNIKHEIINKNFFGSDIFINDIIKQIKDKQICLIIASKSFKNLLKTSIYYNKEKDTFYDIPILENLEAISIADSNGNLLESACFVDKKYFIDVYIKTMPYIKEKNKEYYTLSMTYNSVMDKNVNIYRFYFKFGLNAIKKHPSDIIDENIQNSFTDLVSKTYEQLENHYSLLTLIRALKTNNILFEVIKIKLEKEKLIIDEILEISFSNQIYTIIYDNSDPFRLTSIENVLIMIKLYKNKIEQFKHLIKYNYEKETHRSSDHIVEQIDNMSQHSTANSIFGNLLESINKSPNINTSDMEKIRLTSNGIIIKGDISIVVDEPSDLVFTDLRDNQWVFRLPLSWQAIALIELYFNNNQIFTTITYGCSVLIEMGQYDNIKNYVKYIFEDNNISNIENKIKEYFNKEQYIEDQKIKYVIEKLQEGDTNE